MLWKKMPELTKEEAGRALDAACSQVIRNLDQFTDHFQKAYSENGFMRLLKMWTGRRDFGPGKYGLPMNIRAMRL